MAGHPTPPVASVAHEELTYPSPNIEDFTLDGNDLERRLPLDNGRHHLDPKADLGVLDRLPIELLGEVLVQVDLASLTHFRRVNQRAMQIVDSIPQYRAILQHSPASLRGVLAIGTGSFMSCEKLFHALSAALCEDCQDFGGFIYLLTCTRVCFICFTEDTKYLPLSPAELKRKFGLNHSSAANIPGMHSVPGCYSPNKKICRTRMVLYDPESARRAAETHYGSAAAMSHHVDAVASKRLEAYQERISIWAHRKNGPRPRQPPPTVAWDGYCSNPRRYMAIVRAPWLDPLTKLSDWGFHCSGCEDEDDHRPLHWRRKYSTYTFDEHIRECGYVREGSIEGTYCHPTFVTDE